MLSFDASLTSALNTASTEAFWVLKLYYNAEGSSDFIGVSDQDRIDGSDTYYGVVASWGSLTHALDFFNFSTSTSNMSVSIINTDKMIENGRFSDLFSTYNFANRKWELFQNTGRNDTYDTAARMVGSGIISGDISYNNKSLSLTLLDYSSRYHKQLPINRVSQSSYPNAPEKNIGKPIPMSYGDFYEKTGIGTIPTTYFDRHYYFYKGAFPAIITNKFNVSGGSSEAKIDNEVMHTLDNENIYIYEKGYYPTLTGTVDATTNNPLIEYSADAASVYIPISTSNTGSETGIGSYAVSDEERISDINFSSVASWSANGAIFNNSNGTMEFAVPKTVKLGEYNAISVIVKWGTVSDLSGEDNDFFRFTANATNEDLDTITSDSETKTSIGNLYAGKTDSWDFEGSIKYGLYSGTANESAQIYESGLQVDFDISAIESNKIIEQYEESAVGGFAVQTQFEKEEESFSETIIRTRTKTVNTPSEIEYIYCSGKGRKYGSWISDGGRSVGYATTDFIENPIFIIEDIMRTELSLTDTEINESSFNTSGNSTNGHLGDIYNDSVGDIKFAFSQPRFINSKDLIDRLSKQSMSWVYISGNGKFSIKTLRQTGDYSSADKTIDFNDVRLKSISKTPLGGVRNDIVINYSYDYGQNQFLASENPTADATSTGNTVNGYKQTLTLKMDADIIDSTTATKLAEAYRDIFKDRRILISFDCLRAKYNDLEIGDIITFSNWDSNVKIYGTAMSTDYYMIIKINKTPHQSGVEAIKVS